MKQYTIRFTPEAIANLKNIYDYLTTAISGDVAEKVHQKIITDIYALKTMPERTAVYDQGMLKGSKLRKYLAAKHYQVFLTVDNDARVVFIVHIFFAASDYDSELRRIALQD